MAAGHHFGKKYHGVPLDYPDCSEISLIRCYLDAAYTGDSVGVIAIEVSGFK